MRAALPRCQCFDAIKGPCDITEERANDDNAAGALCSTACIASLGSKVLPARWRNRERAKSASQGLNVSPVLVQECEKASDLTQAVHDECSLDYCNRGIAVSPC